MALSTTQTVHLAAAGAAYRAFFDPIDSVLAAAAETLAENAADYTQEQLDAVESALGVRLHPRARDESLDAAIVEALTVAGAALP